MARRAQGVAPDRGRGRWSTKTLSGGLALLLGLPAPMWAQDPGGGAPQEAEEVAPEGAQDPGGVAPEAEEVAPEAEEVAPEAEEAAPEGAADAPPEGLQPAGPGAPSDPVPAPPADVDGVATAPAVPEVPQGPSPDTRLLYARGRDRTRIGLTFNLTGTAVMATAAVIHRTDPDDAPSGGFLQDTPGKALALIYVGTFGAPPAAAIGPLQMRQALRRGGVEVPGWAGWLGLAVPLVGVPAMIGVGNANEAPIQTTLGLVAIPVLTGMGLSGIQYRQNQIAFSRAGWDGLPPVTAPYPKGQWEDLRTFGNFSLVLVGATTAVVCFGAAMISSGETTTGPYGIWTRHPNKSRSFRLLALAAAAGGTALFGIEGLSRPSGWTSKAGLFVSPLMGPELNGLGVSGQF